MASQRVFHVPWVYRAQTLLIALPRSRALREAVSVEQRAPIVSSILWWLEPCYSIAYSQLLWNDNSFIRSQALLMRTASKFASSRSASIRRAILESLVMNLLVQCRSMYCQYTLLMWCCVVDDISRLPESLGLWIQSMRGKRCTRKSFAIVVWLAVVVFALINVCWL